MKHLFHSVREADAGERFGYCRRLQAESEAVGGGSVIAKKTLQQAEDRRRRRRFRQDDTDPQSLVANLFDVAMVFAVALMVALVTKFNMTEIFSQEDYTIVKNPGKENMEIIIKNGEKIEKYTPDGSADESEGTKGKKIGIAYELPNGQIVYVPE